MPVNPKIQEILYPPPRPTPIQTPLFTVLPSVGSFMPWKTQSAIQNVQNCWVFLIHCFIRWVNSCFCPDFRLHLNSKHKRLWAQGCNHMIKNIRKMMVTDFNNNHRLNKDCVTIMERKQATLVTSLCIQMRKKK